MVKWLFADKMASAEGANGAGSGMQPGQPNPDAQLQITAQLPDGRTVHIHSSALGAAMAQDAPRDGTGRGAAGGIIGGAAFTHQVGSWSGLMLLSALVAEALQAFAFCSTWLYSNQILH